MKQVNPYPSYRDTVTTRIAYILSGVLGLGWLLRDLVLLLCLSLPKGFRLITGTGRSIPIPPYRAQLSASVL